MPTPDERLPGVTTAEKAVSRAKDDVRLANDWKSYYAKHFERERYTLPRPSDTHQMPDSDTINKKIDEILSGAITQCKDAIDQHLLTCIAAAEERIKNPPASSEEMWRNMTKKFESHYERTMRAMMDNLARTMLRLQGREPEQRVEHQTAATETPDEKQATTDN